MAARALICFLTIPWLLGGCIEILSALNAIQPGDTNGTQSPDDDGIDPNGNGDSDGIPVVSLRVSNPFPQMNETVALTCSLDAGNTEGLTFDFQPDDGFLDQGRRAGTAEFTASEPDINVEFTYTCTATNAFGTSNRSNTVTVLPTNSLD
jgi:hypothetical protein